MRILPTSLLQTSMIGAVAIIPLAVWTGQFLTVKCRLSAETEGWRWHLTVRHLHRLRRSVWPLLHGT